MKQLINCDSIGWLFGCREKYRMVFADPPDAIGLGYKGFNDKFGDIEYRELISDTIHRSALVADVVWLSFNSIHTPLVGWLTYQFLQSYSDWEFKPCVQIFSFGQHNKNDLGNNHRPLYRYMRKGTSLYPEQVKIPSWRQLHGDKRAKADGRVPGDTFDFIREAPQADLIREIQLLQRERDLLLDEVRDDGRIDWSPKGFWIDDVLCGETLEEAIWRYAGGNTSDDVFDHARVTGNSKQRRAFSPTQLNEALYERCIKLCCKPGDTVVDLFAGSGTLGRVADRCGVNAVMVEISRETCDNILKDQPDVEEVDAE